jgi:hypothetical protein
MGPGAAVLSLCHGLVKEEEEIKRESDIKEKDDDKPLIP